MQLKKSYHAVLILLSCAAMPAQAGLFDFLNKNGEARPLGAGAATLDEQPAAPLASATVPAPAASIDPHCAPAPVKPAKTNKKNNGKKSAAAEAPPDCMPAPPAPPAQAAPIAQAAPAAQAPGLFSSRQMSGRELINEMRAIRSSLGTSNPLAALSSLLIPPPADGGAGAAAPPTAAAPAVPLQFLSGIFGGGAAGAAGNFNGSLTSLAGDAVLDMLISNVSYAATDIFFAQILDDKDALSKVFVDLPDVANLTPDLRKRVVNLAAFLAAIKASGLIIDSSLREFDKAKESYRKVVDMREKATRLLGDALYAKGGLEQARRDGQARNQQLLSQADTDYLAAFQDKKPEELIKDFAAQNIALAYLRSKDPKAFQDYSVEISEVKSHYGAYVRTGTGAGAMVGLSAIFLRQSKKLVEQQGGPAAAAVLPLLVQGVTELVTLAPRVKNVFGSGDDISSGSFQLMRGGDVVKRGVAAKSLFGALDEQALNQFKAELINVKGNGYLLGLYKRNPASAGQLADRVVSKDAKGVYVKDYLQSEGAADFSFQNAFDGKVQTKVKKNLVQDLFLAPADAASTDGRDVALAKVQNDLRNNLSDYTNSDMRKFMFINSAGNAANPKLQLAQYTVTIDSLGMDGLVDYDAMVASLSQAKIRSYDEKPKAKPGAK